MATVTRANRAAKKRPSPLGDEIATVLHPTSDVQTVIATVVGDERAAKWVDAIRRVRMRGLVGGVKWEDEQLHEPNSPQERRFCAMLLMILCEVSPQGRAWTSRLFRGRQKQETDDGRKVYVPAKSAGGMAARLGCSPREIDRYLQVAKAAGIVEVWQGPSDAPKRFRGAEYAYAVFRWLGEIPRAVQQRLARWWGRWRPPAEKLPAMPEAPEAPRVARPESAARFEAFALTDQEPQKAPERTQVEHRPPTLLARFQALIADT